MTFSLLRYSSSLPFLSKCEDIALSERRQITVSSGIEFDKYEEARAEIFAQLEAVKNGDITEEELLTAKRGVSSELRSAMDSQGELEGFWLSQAMDGLDYGPMELAELVEDVTKEDVMAIARSIEPDLIYFLKGFEDEETEDAET